MGHVSISGILIHLQDYLAAQAHAHQAVAIYHRNSFTRGLQTAPVALARAEKWVGEFESACIHYQEALAGHLLLPPSTVINCLYGLGQARFRKGNLDAVLSHFDAALNLAREGRIVFRV